MTEATLPTGDVGAELPTHEGTHQDHEEEIREGVHGVDEAHDQPIGAATDIAGDRADDHPDDQGQQGGGNRDGHRDTGAIGEAREHVTPELISAEQMLLGGRGVPLPEILIIVGEGQRGGENRGDNDDQQNDQADNGRRVAADARNDLPTNRGVAAGRRQ